LPRPAPRGQGKTVSTSADARLVLPDLSRLEDWLGAQPSDPFSRQVDQAFAGQHLDGSWGSGDDPVRRVLPTLWMAKVLGELGHAHDPRWSTAADFLIRTAHTDDDVFSVDGRRSGVLSCYVGTAVEVYLRGGRDDAARPQIEWIVRYQDLRCGGASRRHAPVPVWSPDLAWRYGGCLADSTCLIGLVKGGLALLAWQQAHGQDAAGAALLQQIVDTLLERELFKASSGEPVALGTPPGRPGAWLEPTYPLDWHTDLIEVVHLVAQARGPDPRMQAALDRLAAQQLSDGSWPLRRTFRPIDLPLLERRSATRGSLLVSRRAHRALSALAGPAVPLPS